ncbi:uncharacterized protein [Argopecten irradians]|uniref:uncharacterized protein n=1 Tax=Argopecten irradians TaxID=31199 RepID=UPI003724B92F
MNGSTLISLVWITLIGYAACTEVPMEMLGECVKTCGYKGQPTVRMMDRECMKKDDCLYCKYYGCPIVECHKKGKRVPPTLTPDRRCLVCEDECIHGWDIFKKGDTFVALDDINHCECKAKGRVLCKLEKKNPSVRDFCEL